MPYLRRTTLTTFSFLLLATSALLVTGNTRAYAQDPFCPNPCLKNCEQGLLATCQACEPVGELFPDGCMVDWDECPGAKPYQLKCIPLP